MIQKLSSLKVFALLSVGLLFFSLTRLVSGDGSCRYYAGIYPTTPPPTPIYCNPSHVAVTWVRIDTIESYEPLGRMRKYLDHTLDGTLPTPYTFELAHLDPDDVEDLAFDFAGSGDCQQEADNDIHCTGTVTHLTVHYHYTFTPTVQADTVLSSPQSWSSFPIDYTLIEDYIDPLVFVSSVPPPNAQLDHRLAWTVADMRIFTAKIVYRDPRIQTTYLPAIQR